MKGRTYQANFTMGRISDENHGLVHLEIYTKALADAVNVLPAITGPIRRRAGFLHEGGAKFAAAAKLTRLVPFQRPMGERLQLEFGDGYVRFWTPDGGQLMSGGAPYEIVSPYTAADLEGLRWWQSNDVVYLAHKSRLIRPRVLQRRDVLDWAFVELENRNGPWRRENGDPTKYVTPSAATGLVNLTASFMLFTPQHVGSLMRFRENTGNPGVPSWAPGNDTPINSCTLSDGKVYYSEGPHNWKTGTTPPLHDSGSVPDGSVSWKYLHDGAGIVLITGYVSPWQVTGMVLATIPVYTYMSGKPYWDPGAPPVPIAMNCWTEAAWSDVYGWPGDVDGSERQLQFGGTAAEPGRIDITRINGFGPDWADFKPGLGTGRVVSDDAVSRTVAGGAEPIRWLKNAGSLMVGTNAREAVISGSSLDEPVTPEDTQIRGLTFVGSAEVAPVVAHDGVMFVRRGGRGLNYVRLAADQSMTDADLSMFVEDLVHDQLEELAWAPHPDNVLWARTSKGALLSMVYQPRQNVFGWQRHVIGGEGSGFVVESLSVLESDDGRDTLWMVVRRTKGGVDQRLVLRQAPRWRKGDPLDLVVFLDACERYEGPAVTRLTGLDHLVGETVRVFGNEGALLFDRVVDGLGGIDLGEPVTKACVGLRYVSEIETLDLDIQGPAGTIGLRQRVTDVTVFLADFVSGWASWSDGQRETVSARPWGEAVEPRKLVDKVAVGADADRAARVRVGTDDAWPMTLLAVRTVANAND